MSTDDLNSATHFASRNSDPLLLIVCEADTLHLETGGQYIIAQDILIILSSFLFGTAHNKSANSAAVPGCAGNY
jgi:hypothetical protein